MDKVILFTIILILIDIPFIKLVIKNLYQGMGFSKNMNILYVALAYITMGLSWFFIKGDIVKAALIGHIIFATYAFTALAVIPGYVLKTGIVEIIWGPILFMSATYLTNKIKI